MLKKRNMKTKRALQLATILVSMLGPAALAERAPAGPDFVGAAPQRHVPAKFAASDGTAPLAPLDVVVFEHARSALIPSAIAQVDRAAKWLRAHPGYRIVLAGHADTLGNGAYNEDLANRRVNLVRAHLMGWGIKSDRIIVITYGDTEALDPETPLDRKVVLYATQQTARQVVAETMADRPALTAMWTEGPTLFEQHGTSIAARQPPSKEAIATRR